MAKPIEVLLSRLGGGDRDALNDLMPLIYDELRRIAEGYVRREARQHTLQATDLVHEAYLRLAEYGIGEYKSRVHFLRVAARVMRQILVDHARTRRAMKRDGDTTVARPGTPVAAKDRNRTLIALDDALMALAIEDPWKASLVEMRFCGGMSADEIAASVDKPLRTVKRDLRFAYAWLRRELAPEMGRNHPEIS